MKNITIIIILILLIPIVLAVTNLDFRLDVEEKGFYPNQKIPLDVVVVNRDATFAARDAELTVNIGNRFYTFDLGDLEPGETFKKEIILPEFPAGTHSIKGDINYTGILDEKFIEVSYGSFEVLFPPIERYPRNVFVSGYDLPEKIIGGKSYDVRISITNDGEVSADLLIEFGSIDEFFEEKTTLKPGESVTVEMNVKFDNPGVSLIEARAYALIDDEKYLLNYRGKKTYVQAERKAKLVFDRVEFIDEPDNIINPNDEVKLKVYLSNIGNYPATSVIGTLGSPSEVIGIVKDKSNYEVISVGESFGSNEIFEIKSKETSDGEVMLNLKVDYIDSEPRIVVFEVPVKTKQSGEACTSNDQCKSNEICQDSDCVKITCDCGYAENHICKKYECCANSQCNGLICNQETHVCEIPSELKVDVLIVTIGNKLEKTNDYTNILNDYRETLKSEGLSSFYLELDSNILNKFFNVQLVGNEWRTIKSVLDKVLIKTEAKYLLILGGIDVIPQPPAKTSAEIPFIPHSDDRYSDIDKDGLPDIAIGRIPTVKKDVSTIISVLQSSIKMHKKNTFSKVVLADTCIFPPSCWGIEDVNKITQLFFNKDCSETEQCKPAPPYCDDKECNKKEEFFFELLNNDIVYLDAHGSTFSFAAHTADGWVDILTSSSLYEKPFVNNPIFSSAACLAAKISDGEGKKASAFSFLNNGASVFIGDTAYGYGGITADLQKEIFTNFNNGKTIGESVMNMKIENLKNSNSDWKNAVIYEIQLYGDPTLKIN